MFKIKENTILAYGVSFFLLIAGINIMFDGIQYTSFEYSVLYILMAALLMLMLVLNKVSKRKRKKK